MTTPRWLRETGRDEWTLDRIDPCEAGTCGHRGCWQDPDARPDRLPRHDPNGPPT